MTQQITIVAGLPRSGTSLMMQMLNAAGIRCARSNPDFEPEETMGHPSEDFVESMVGGAFKLLDPQERFLPHRSDYRFIWMTRSRRQQAISMFKVMESMGVFTGYSNEDYNRACIQLKTDSTRAEAILQSYGCQIVGIRFEDLIERSEWAVGLLAEKLGFSPEQQTAMLACIVPRSARSLPIMLEPILLAKEKAKEGQP